MSKKKYSKPGKLYDLQRIKNENLLIEKYGLKNKREIWKAEYEINKIRTLAKDLITESDEQKNKFIERLQKKGFKVKNIPEVLGLNKEDILKRRLQTLVFEKKLTSTPKQARQVIIHKHVSIGDQIINIPSYKVSADEENQIKLNLSFNIKESASSKPEKTKKETEDEEIAEIEKLEKEIVY
jgi:small subunit ribosomal protein S4